MNKRILSLLICLFISSYTFAQKIFVWCPPEAEVATANNKLSGLDMNIIIKDIRKITDTSRVECSSTNLVTLVANTITRNYPAAIINVLDTNQYTAPPEKAKITVRIAISAYHSASGITASTAIGTTEGDFSWGALPKNKWNSVAGFHVVIDDYRTETLRTLTRNIANIVSRPNIGGSLTAKKALLEAYKEANRELLYFIESTLL